MNIKICLKVLKTNKQKKKIQKYNKIINTNKKNKFLIKPYQTQQKDMDQKIEELQSHILYKNVFNRNISVLEIYQTFKRNIYQKSLWK